jgi:chromosome segregation ATPase
MNSNVINMVDELIIRGKNNNGSSALMEDIKAMRDDNMAGTIAFRGEQVENKLKQQIAQLIIELNAAKQANRKLILSKNIEASKTHWGQSITEELNAVKKQNENLRRENSVIKHRNQCLDDEIMACHSALTAAKDMDEDINEQLFHAKNDAITAKRTIRSLFFKSRTLKGWITKYREEMEYWFAMASAGQDTIKQLEQQVVDLSKQAYADCELPLAAHGSDKSLTPGEENE